MAIQYFTQPEGKVLITARGGHAFLRNIKTEDLPAVEALLVEIENDASQHPTVAEIYAGFEKAGCEKIELSETNIAFGPPPANWLELYRGEVAVEVVEPDPVDPVAPVDPQQKSPSVEQDPQKAAENEGDAKQTPDEAPLEDKAPETEEEFRAALVARHPDEADTFKDLKLDELKALWEVSQA
jgi:hypothetical protein